jgi:hypothetical protein
MGGGVGSGYESEYSLIVSIVSEGFQGFDFLQAKDFRVSDMETDESLSPGV